MSRETRNGLVAAFVAALLAGSAEADEFAWNQPDGGIFGDTANWNDGASGVPGAKDAAIFDLFGPFFTVQMTESRTNDRLVIRRGTVSLELTQSDFVYELLSRTAEQPGIVVADEARQIAVARFFGGTFRASRVTVGKSPASSGSLDLGTNGSLETDVLIVGDAGTGFVSMSGGSVTALREVGRVEVGASPSGYGDLMITSPLIVDDELVVGGSGLGIVEIVGATVEAVSVTVARDAGSTGRLTIDGTMNVAGNLEIAPAAGSWGRLVNESGALRVGGDLVVGPDGTGEFELPTSSVSFVVDGAFIAQSPIGIVVQEPTLTPLIEVMGRADLGGIVIEHGELPPPAQGDEYLLVQAASGLAGTLVTPSALPMGLAWEATVTDTQLVARIIIDPLCESEPGKDCNNNGVRDDCDISFGPSADCNANGRPDECDLADATSLDCNANGRPDECDVADGTSDDCNADDVPDDCTPADSRTLLDAFGGTGDAFGATVDVDGPLAVVGSPDASPPYVTVFQQRGTRWVRDVKLVPDDGTPGDGFARSVGIGGSTIVVGAPAADGGAGAAYVFERGTSGVWTEVTRLTPDDSTAGIDAFGVSVATNGDHAIVGARLTSGNQFGGFAYIFARARGWDLDHVFGTTLTTVSGPGASVDIDGDLAAVLWPGLDERDPGQIAAVERFSPGGLWFAQTILTSGGTTIVGPDVAVSGDTIAARIESDDFRGVGVTVRLTSIFLLLDTLIAQPEGNSFGAAIAGSNGRLAVGAAGDGPAGRVYTYRRAPDDTWYPANTLEGDGGAGGTIGSAIALEGGRLIAGAPTDDTQGADAGAAWIADLPGPDCNTNGVWDTCDILGGTSADADGDGVPDECADTCPYDMDESGAVGFNDLSIVLASWGTCPNCLADVNGSGSVGFMELSDLLQAWGDCP